MSFDGFRYLNDSLSLSYCIFSGIFSSVLLLVVFLSEVRDNANLLVGELDKRKNLSASLAGSNQKRILFAFYLTPQIESNNFKVLAV